MTRKVLIVDDEPNIVTSLEFLMRANDYEVCSARTGEEALAEVERFDPDVLLLDLMLPHPGGLEVCRRIRGNRLHDHIRIVILTARDRAAEQEQGRALGADAYLIKPFSTRDVVDTVRGLMP